METNNLEEEILTNLNRITAPLKYHPEYKEKIEGFLGELTTILLTTTFNVKMHGGGKAEVHVNFNFKDKNLAELVEQDYIKFDRVIKGLSNYTDNLSDKLMENYDVKNIGKILKCMLTIEKINSAILLYFNGNVTGYKKYSRIEIQKHTGLNFN